MSFLGVAKKFHRSTRVKIRAETKGKHFRRSKLMGMVIGTKYFDLKGNIFHDTPKTRMINMNTLIASTKRT